MPPPTDGPSSGLRVTFLGVSTLLFDDGETAILTDGFFTRPDKFQLLQLRPDRDLIARCLSRAGITKLTAVVVLHSHFDHSLDAPEVVLQTDSVLVGSESTANIGRGYPLPENRIRVAEDGEAMTFGAFRLTMIRTAHSPSSLLKLVGIDHVPLDGDIREPLKQPAGVLKYQEGGSYTLLVEHAAGTMLVQASAGFEPGALAGRDAEVVFLGVGTLGRQPQGHRDDYWREVVEAVNPKRIVPIHWDDFSRPLDQPLVPLPPWLDDFGDTLAFLRERAAPKNIEIRLLQAWDTIDPFAGL
jgi:L-ascorbate metabolism protein UlaG (beta-lactamase superfamily)